MDDRVIRHPNGGAEKIGTGVHVSQDSFCDELTQLHGESAILHSTLLHTRARNCGIFSSQLKACSIGDSVIAESDLTNLMARGCTLDRVVVAAPSFPAMKLSDVVAENCELHGSWTLEGNARIPAGKWYRAPRFKRITGENGVDVGLTEGLPGYALMACWDKPISKWLSFGPRLGRKHSWMESQVAEAKDFFTMLADCPLDGVTK